MSVKMCRLKALPGRYIYNFTDEGEGDMPKGDDTAGPEPRCAGLQAETLSILCVATLGLLAVSSAEARAGAGLAGPTLSQGGR